MDDVAIVTFSNLNDDSIRYPLRDRLGSVVSLTNAANLVMEHRSYDPFGKPRHGGMQSAVLARLSSVAGGTPYTNRGFTDHEHLDDAELIHMNGRVYDYNLGRFLSVDPFIQAPGNSQSMNPYSYIMNNPLAGTDPSGYLSKCVDEGTNCEETVTPEAGDQIIEDKDGNRYIDKGGDTVTRIDKVSATKNGVTGSVNVRTGEITISAIGSQSETNTPVEQTDDNLESRERGIEAEWGDIIRDENMNITQAEIICDRSCQREASSQIYLSDYEIAQYVMLQSFLESQEQTAEYQAQVLLGMTTLQTRVAGNLFYHTRNASSYAFKPFRKFKELPKSQKIACVGLALNLCGSGSALDDLLKPKLPYTLPKPGPSKYAPAGEHIINPRRFLDRMNASGVD